MRSAQLAALLGVVVALAFVPNLQDATGFAPFYLVYAYFVFFWIAQATSWNILSGYTGYFSFGQGAFYGLGVYTAGDLVTREGVNYFLTIPIAGVLAAALGAAVGALAFRLGSLRGEIFALLTLAVTFTLASVAVLSTWVDGGQGIALPVPDYPAFLGEFQDLIYRLGLAVAALAVVTALLVQGSRFGWGLFSIRDEEDVAEEARRADLPLQDARDHDHRLPRRDVGGGRGAADRLPDARGRLLADRAAARRRDVRARRPAALARPGDRGARHLQPPGAAHELGVRRMGAGDPRRDPRRVILFAPEGLYARLRDEPRRAGLAALALVVTVLVSGVRRLGDCDRLAEQRARGGDARSCWSAGRGGRRSEARRELSASTGSA